MGRVIRTLGVIGCGNMGSALVRSVLAARLIPASRILTWHPDPARLRRAVRRLGIRRAASLRQLARAPVLLLAVKPGQMDGVLAGLRGAVGRRTLVLSVAAGISTRRIERALGPGVPVVRAMPNTPALARAGITALAGGRSAGKADLRAAARIFRCAGEVVEVKERRMDAVTALSGSGPAYFFFLMERMIQAGVRLGLSQAVARELTLRTALGAAALAAASSEPPEKLRAQVTSKGGTTEAALRTFRRAGVGSGIDRGIRTAAARSKRLEGK